MKKQQIAGVVLAAVLVLGIAMFAGYQSTRYPRTLQAANQAVQAGQEAEAVSLYEKAVNVSPKKAEAYLALADIYEKHSQHADAVSVLKKAAEAIPGKSGEAAKIQEKLEELNPTVTASQESGTYQDPVELKLESKSGKEIRYELSEAPDSAPQSYTEPLTFRRNGTYRIKCYAMNQSGEAGEPTELNFTIQLDPEKYHMNSWYQGKDGGWYYNNDAGEPVIGWRLIDNNWYYFADNGRMKTGWMQLDGKYYYLDDNGVIANGWRQFDGRYYYFLSDGSMAANQWVDGAYYVGADGVMLVSTTTPDGNQVDESGKKIEKSRNEKAVEAYRKVLLDRSWNGRGLPGGQFAVVDINGDGVWEVLTDLDIGEGNGIERLLYFTDGLQQYALDQWETRRAYDIISEEHSSREIRNWGLFLPSKNEIVVETDGNHSVTKVVIFGKNQKVVEPPESYYDWYDAEMTSLASGIGFAEVKESMMEDWGAIGDKYYRAPCYQLKFLSINEENINKYLSGQGQSTGMEYIASQHPNIGKDFLD